MKQLLGVLVAVILATLLTLGQTKGASYVKTGDCKETIAKTCIYDYTAAVYLSNGEEVILSAEVKAFCESVGVLNNETVKRYCIEVTNTTVVVTNTNEEDISGLDEPYQYLSDDITNKWFCFAQSTAGKILSVFYPKNEDAEIVNLKKGIVAAFQANFKGTSVEDESDSQSHHYSHYEYSSIGNHKIQRRNINKTDVISFAGNSNMSNKSVQFDQKEEIELDDNDVVVVSFGNTSFKIGGTAKTKTDGKDVDGLDTSKDVPSLAVSTTYKLSLVDCDHEDDTNHRYPRSIMSGFEYNGVTDSIITKRNKRKEDLKLLKELHNAILPLDETIAKLNRRDTDSKTKSNLMSTWKQVLEIEAKHGPLPGTQAKLPQIIQRLKNSQRNDSDVRMTLYYLLSSEGSLESQKALIEMLHQQLSDEEYNNLLLQIAFLPSVDPSTVDYIQKLLETSDNEQLILSFATLGRHNNVADKIIDVLANKLTTTDDTTDIIHIFHALGNTGSKKIIPLLLPFLTDQTLQLYVIDALRTVSLEESVQKAFTDVVLDAEYPEEVIEVVESLLFPFQHSLYFEELPEISFTEEKLIDALFNACTVKFQDKDLNSVIKKYFNTLSAHSTQQNMIEKLQYYLTRTTRIKRSSTTNWNSSSNSNYNLIASQSSRTNDEITYPFHKAFLWAKQYGVSDLHLKVAAGGFGGVGFSGYKLFGRGKAAIYAWDSTFTALDIKYANVKSFNSSFSHVLRNARLAGSTYFALNSNVSIPYLNSVSGNSGTIQLFNLQFSFFIYVGTINLYVRGDINAPTSFNINNTGLSATAYYSIVPTISITGGASASILGVYRIGLEASASLSYTIRPTASAEICDTSRPADAVGCFKVYTQPGGSISVYAYWQLRTIKCRWNWVIPNCQIIWGGKNKFSGLSHTWSYSGSLTLLFGYCRVCNCYNSVFNLLCNKSGSGGCSCYNTNSGLLG